MTAWRALLTAVRDRIRSVCAYTERDCELTFDGQPHPRCGKVFVAIHKGRRNASNKGTNRTALDQEHEVHVTVTMRVNEPFDRLGTDLLLKASDGMQERVDAIVAAVHRDAYDYVVSGVANTALGDAGGGAAPIGFRIGLAYVDDGPERIEGGRWFHADPQANEAGIVTVIRFGGARRIQHFDAMS